MVLRSPLPQWEMWCSGKILKGNYKLESESLYLSLLPIRLKWGISRMKNEHLPPMEYFATLYGIIVKNERIWKIMSVRL
jgi:hypothetical protein